MDKELPWYNTKGGIAGISGLTSGILAGLLGADIPQSLAYGTMGASKGVETNLEQQRLNEEKARKDLQQKQMQDILNQRLEISRQSQMQDMLNSQEDSKQREFLNVQKAISGGMLSADEGNKYLQGLGINTFQMKDPTKDVSQAGTSLIDVGNKKILVNKMTGEPIQEYDVTQNAMQQPKLQALNLGNRQVMVNPLTGEEVKSFDISKEAMQSEMPATVREYEYFNSLNPEAQKNYLAMKRSAQIMNLGGQQSVYNPLGGGIQESFAVTPKPEQMPEFKGQQAFQTALGKQQAETQESITSQTSKLPRLEKTVSELSDLGKKATYTKGGQLVNELRRQAGLEPTEGAIARAEYIAKVDNQILPLLKDTFGAQFTEREGQTLRSTLGNPDLSPKEKDAVLKSFIEQKRRDIKNLQSKYQISTQPMTLGRFKIRMK